MCPAMQYIRMAIAQYLIHMCPDDVGASDEHRAASVAGTLRLSPNDINNLLDNLSLSQLQGACGDISVYSSIIMRCDAFSGAQTIRCYPFGVAYQFHSKNIQDTVFAIPARMDRDSFDISDPAHEKELVFGRLYCIFQINIFDINDIEHGELKERDLVLIKVSKLSAQHKICPKICKHIPISYSQHHSLHIFLTKVCENMHHSLLIVTYFM